jgi:NADPH:quinone reductase-like Zn-dependent oxidoreductase
MRTLVITEHGPPEVLRVEERPDPRPGSGDVRIAVRAAGVNFADLMARVGIYPDAPKPPSVVGYEVAGEVESVGDGVENVAVGDRVIAGPASAATRSWSRPRPPTSFRFRRAGASRRGRRCRSTTPPRTPGWSATAPSRRASVC